MVRERGLYYHRFKDTDQIKPNRNRTGRCRTDAMAHTLYPVTMHYQTPKRRMNYAIKKRSLTTPFSVTCLPKNRKFLSLSPTPSLLRLQTVKTRRKKNLPPALTLRLHITVRLRLTRPLKKAKIKTTLQYYEYQ